MLSFFDILGLPEQFTLNDKALEEAYFAAQRKVHPDKLIGKGEAERAETLRRSQQVNDAYDTLKDPLSRAEHILALHGILVHSEEDNQVPPALLMEMMELRERIEAQAHDGRGLLSMAGEVKKAARTSVKELEEAFTARNYEAAAAETIRLSYLTKALEEAYMLLYQFKTEAHP